MCGIFGIAGPGIPDDHAVAELRDRLAHRGPVGAGLWRIPGLVLAHRRLAVIDLSPAGAQPMALPDGSALVYNGEVYNDEEVRRDLAARGRALISASDAETVLHALHEWGAAGLARLRGMYALAFFHGPTRRLLLARDPLGIKPLNYRLGAAGAGRTLTFASEPGPILACPGVAARPDLAALSGYLTTIRMTLGERTLFEGVSTLRPGEVLTFNLDAAEPRIIARASVPFPRVETPLSPGGWAAAVRDAVEDSVRRHLRSDVPIACLLSGGLDSSIIAAVARRHSADLHTYCSGARGAPPMNGVPQSDDFEYARLAAAHLGTIHAEAPVTREIFAERWPQMVERLGVPLSTPNEVAIHEVARAVRRDGRIVALSGEGADELFAGYEWPMQQAANFASMPRGTAECARFHLDAAAWVGSDAKAQVLNPDLWRALEGDSALLEAYAEEFGAVAAERPDADPLQSHLRFHRRINLAGLLLRLDSAAMLAGVEGRTPLADATVAALAESLPMSAKFDPGPPARTKIVLREAFSPGLPPAIASRPKASFPLPFQAWVADTATALAESDFAKAVFCPEALAAVCADPAGHWRWAWPMVNIAIWGRRWWG